MFTLRGPGKPLLTNGALTHATRLGRRARYLSVVVISTLIIGLAPSVSVAQDGAPAASPAEWDAMQTHAIALQLQDDRNSSEARARRKASRTKHKGLNHGQARKLARESFGSDVFKHGWKPLHLSKGDRVEEYRGRFTAELEDADGNPAGMALSSLPLRSEVGSGKPADVFLGLQEFPDEYRPSNPLVATVIAKDPRDGVSFPDHRLSVRFAGAVAADSPSVVNDTVFFSNVEADTDMTVSPAPTGAEASFILRSEASPERLVLDFDLPEGARLRVAEHDAGAVEVVTDDGPLAAVLPPYAWDAAGVSVPVRYRVTGRTVAVLVDHRDGDYEYPLNVDPYVDNYQLDGNGNRAPAYVGVSNWDGWVLAARGTFGYGVFDPTYQYKYPGDAWGSGLHIRTRANTSYASGDYGQFIWKTPPERSNAFIKRVDFGYVHHRSPFNSYYPNTPFTCLLEGVYQPSTASWDTGEWIPANGEFSPDKSIHPGPSSPWRGTNSYKYPDRRSACSFHDNNYKRHDPTAPSNGNAAVFGLEVGTRLSWESQQFPWPDDYQNRAYMYGATLYLEDRNAPQGTISGPSGWQDGGQSAIVVTGTDTGGLGIRGWSIYPPPGQPARGLYTKSDNTTTADGSLACKGDPYRHKCPQNPDPATTLFDNSSFSEGINTIHGQAWDATGKATNIGSWPIKIDRTPPQISDVRLIDNATGQTLDPSRESLTGSSYKFRMSLSDTPSGVKDTRVYIDGGSTPVATFTGTDWDFSPSVFGGDGPHTIRFAVRDQVATPAHTAWSPEVSVVVDQTGSVFRAVASEGDPAAGAPIVGDESADLNGARARIDAPDGFETQRTVSCTHNTQGCMETRTYSSASHRYLLAQSRAPYDGRLAFSELLAGTSESRGTLVSSGPLDSALQPWQIPPPGHGPQVEVYEAADSAAVDGADVVLTTRLYVDSTYKLPLRRTELAGSTVEEDTFYSYDRVRLSESELPPNFFAPPTPAGATSTTTDYGEPPPAGAVEPGPPEPSIAELVSATKAFNSRQGFESTDSEIESLLADPSRQEVIDRLGAALSPAQEAEMNIRLAVQDSMPTVDAFVATRQTTYAGVYMDRTAGLLYVGFTANAGAEVDALKALHAYPARLRAFTASRSLAQLEQTRSSIVHDWNTGQLPVVGVSTVGIDVKANNIVVGMRNATGHAQSELTAKYGPTVVVVASDPVSATARRHKAVAGTLIDTDPNNSWGKGPCTLGFNSFRNRPGPGNKLVRQYYAVTAGHCFPDIDGEDGDPGNGGFVLQPVINGDYNRIGRMEEHTLDSDGGEAETDAGSINLVQRLRTAYVFARRQNDQNRYLRVGGFGTVPQQGWTICGMGKTTGHTVCGELTKINETVEIEADDPHDDDDPVKNRIPMYEVDFSGDDVDCSVQGGDSGGPAWRAKRVPNGGIGAVGIISAFERNGAPPQCMEEPDPELPGFEVAFGSDIGYIADLVPALLQFDQQLLVKRDGR